MKKKQKKTKFDPLARFNLDDCEAREACGECLSRCPYVRLSKRRAAREILRLREGRRSVLLDHCAGCMTCSTVCPRGCDPYALIRARWYERYLKKGLPARAGYMMPHVFPNFRSTVKLSKSEKSLLRKIASPPDADTVLYTGCNSLVYPSIYQSSIFDGLPPFGSLEYCCGEMYYRMGLLDTARESALGLKETFARLKVKKMVFICAACMDMLAYVFPREFGIDFDFEKQFLAEWLLEKIDAGEIRLKKPVRKKVVVHDACHAKIMGPEIHDAPRRLLERLGAEVVEPTHSKNSSLCCGIAAGCPRYSLADMLLASFRRLREFRESGADSAVTYCNGCQISLGMVRLFTPWVPPLVPLVQLVQKAAGERPALDLPSIRSRQVLAGIISHAGPKMLSRRRFFMRPIR